MHCAVLLCPSLFVSSPLPLCIQCNTSGYFTPQGNYGLMSFDWSNARDVWSSNPTNATNCSQVLVEQARHIKQASPSTKVLVYRNLELGLQWLESERAAMANPAYFMRTPDGAVYSEPIPFGNQVFWNFVSPVA